MCTYTIFTDPMMIEPCMITLGGTLVSFSKGLIENTYPNGFDWSNKVALSVVTLSSLIALNSLMDKMCGHSSLQVHVLDYGVSTVRMVG